MLIKRCEVCGRMFTARRSTARFCSSTCRVRAHRGTVIPSFAGKLEPVRVDETMTDDKALEIVQIAHAAADDLSRASMMAAAPLCLRLGRAAKGMDDALRREGL